MPSSQQRPSKAGEPGAPDGGRTGPRCPDASVGLRNTPSPGSHKSGFYVAMNRGKQWIYFRLRRNWPSLGLPPAIRSLNMAGPGIPGWHGSLTKTRSAWVWGRRFHPPLGSVAGRVPSPSMGGSDAGSPGCQQGPAGADCPITPSLRAQVGPWPPEVSRSCPQNEKPLRDPSHTAASLGGTSPLLLEPAPKMSQKPRCLPPAPHCLRTLSSPVGWTLSVPGAA